MIEQIRDTLKQNLSRVENLIKTYETYPDAQGQGRKPAHVLDTLRAAVVFLHASMEDVLRTIARWKLPSADRKTLDEIPLAGQKTNSKKFSLGDLIPHRGKTVDQLFEESVEESLQKSNYNNTGEIAAILTAVGVDVSKVNAQFSKLQEMMDRRHQIVHRADRQQSVVGSGDHKIRSINKETVREWAVAVSAFANDLLGELQQGAGATAVGAVI